MTFKPRLNSPAKNNIYYYSSKNIFYSLGYTLPTCETYAWGRFYEECNVKPRLSTSSAENWYNYIRDGYSRGSNAKLGAIACWVSNRGIGQLAVVEKINSNDSIVCSGSMTNDRFYTRTLSKPYTFSPVYKFQGFIYNPHIKTSNNKLAQFIKEAYSHVGEDGTWTYKVSGLGVGQPWCAAFVVACAKKVGILDVIIPLSYGAGAIPRIGSQKGWGKWMPGPAQGYHPTPQPGDLVVFRWGVYPGETTFFSDHIGIVREVSKSKVYTIEGNSTGSRVTLKEYDINSTCLNGYYRPNWAKVGGDVSDIPNYSDDANTSNIGKLYDTVNTRADAIVREVAYVNSNSKPSISASDKRLSMINYTTTLGALFQGTNSVSTSTVSSASLDKLDNLPREIIEYLMKKGLNTAASVGIVANIKHESNYNTAAKGDYLNSSPTSFGLCQWHAGRGAAMKKMAGSNWTSNLSGQLNYLWYELSNSYTSVLSQLKQVTNNESGARSAADIFVRQFERPANIDSESLKRQASASEIYKKIIQVLTK